MEIDHLISSILTIITYLIHFWFGEYPWFVNVFFFIIISILIVNFYLNKWMTKKYRKQMENIFHFHFAKHEIKHLIKKYISISKKISVSTFNFHMKLYNLSLLRFNPKISDSFSLLLGYTIHIIVILKKIRLKRTLRNDKEYSKEYSKEYIKKEK